MGKINQKISHRVRARARETKKDVVAVHMIGRLILLMTSQVIHICRNDYSDVETMIFI